MSRHFHTTDSRSCTSLLYRIELLERRIAATPIVQIADERVNLFAKLESFNVVGSVKDKAALWMLKRAIERGDIGEGGTVIESSSGNFALALSYFCQELGLRFIPVIDPNVSPVYEASLRETCARVVKVTERDDTGGFLKTRLQAVQALLAKIPGAYWPNQYRNIDIADAHHRFAGSELAGAFAELDYAFIGVGSGGTIAGVSQRLKERFPKVRIVAVDAEGSVIFGGPPKKRQIPGLGSSIVPDLLRHARIDQVMTVSEVDTVASCRRLLSQHGLFLGGSSGTVYAAIQRHFAARTSGRKPNVAFICPDGGRAYEQTIYNDRWAASLVKSHAVSAPLPLGVAA